MADDKYKLADKSNTELRAWIAEHEEDTAEYAAGIEESMRRVAAMEEVMEKNEAPIWKREAWRGGESWGLEPQHIVEVGGS